LKWESRRAGEQVISKKERSSSKLNSADKKGKVSPAVSCSPDLLLKKEVRDGFYV
jgi:hypothetical protein